MRDRPAFTLPLGFLFMGSGCAALIYEVVWFQLLRFVVGASTLSLGFVLASFMGGLLIGSLLFHRFVSIQRHPLRVYALLELGIAGFGILLPLLLPLMTYVYVPFALGHLPALLHPNPKSVLIVGFGTGMTAGVFALYPEVERITIVEIEPQVAALGGEFFASENYAVLDDPRTEIVYDDARHFVATTDQSFDVITSDPIHPWVKGAAALYTVEYFELCKRHLNPGGVVTQWVPFYETSEAAVKSEIATFMAAFPNGTLWNTLEPGSSESWPATSRSPPISSTSLPTTSRPCAEASRATAARGALLRSTGPMLGPRAQVAPLAPSPDAGRIAARSRLATRSGATFRRASSRSAF